MPNLESRLCMITIAVKSIKIPVIMPLLKSFKYDFTSIPSAIERNPAKAVMYAIALTSALKVRCLVIPFVI